MKKPLLIIIATILFTNLVNGQAKWELYKVDERVSVKLPFKPLSIDEEGIMAGSPDSTFSLNVMVLDFKKISDIDSAQMVQIIKKPEFLQVIKSNLEARLKITLEDVKLKSINNLSTLEMHGIKNNSWDKYHYLRFVLVGHTFYGMYAFFKRDDNLKIRDDFFSSFSLSK